MRKILACLLTIMLLFSVSAMAEESEWNYDKSWGYVNGYTGPGGDVVVPSVIDGNAVRVIQERGLSRRDDITSFTVPEGVIVLGENVLSTAPNLKSVSLPSTLQVIGDRCFYKCDGLTEITIPASVRLFGISAITLCKGLETLTFEGPCPVVKDSSTALLDNPKMVIRVPDHQLEAYRAAFYRVKPEQIQPSGRNALPQPELHAEYTVDPGTGTLEQCVSEDAWIEVPAVIDGVQVRAIEQRAFAKNDFCYGIILPEGLETIGQGAFDGLSRLTHAPIPSTVREIGAESYAYYNGNRLVLPEGLTEIASRTFKGSQLAGKLVIPDGVTRIGDEAFSGTNIAAVYLPPSLTEIGSRAFEGYIISEIHLENPVVPQIAEDAFKSQNHDITVSLPPAATEADVAAAQAFFNTLGEKFTVVRLEAPNGVYPSSPYAQPAATEAPPEPTAAPTTVPTEVPVSSPTEAPASEPTNVPAVSGPLPEVPQIEGVSLDPQDYIGTWYSIYYGTGGFTGDPRAEFDWQDIMTLNADGTVDGNMGGSLSSWGVDPETGYVTVGPVGVVILPDGYLQYNNRISGYMIMSRDPDAVWDPATPMYEDLTQAAMGAGQPTPEPTEVPVVTVNAAPLAAGDGSIATETKYVCVRYGVGDYEMDASVLGAELSVVLHADGSLDFNMLGNPVPDLTWTWDGNEAVADYYGAGELRFTPGEDGTVILNFMNTMTYILAAS